MLKMIQRAETCFRQSYDAYVFCSPHMDENTASEKDRQFRQNLINAAMPKPIWFFDHVVTINELRDVQEDCHPKADPRLLIFLDDLESTFHDQMTASLFCRLSSHSNIDAVVSAHQAIGNPAKNFRLIMQNTNTYIIMRNMSDRLAISQLSSRIFPQCDNVLSKCLNILVRILGPYAFLVIDCSNSSKLNEKFPIRSNIFFEQNQPMFLIENPLNSK